MHHDHHHHHHDDSPGKETGKNLLFALFLNTLFVIIEFVGGFLTNSVAIISDAVHDLGDSLSLGLSYYFHQKSRRKRDSRYNYGYGRFSLLGAFITSMVLTVSSLFIIQESVKRISAPEQPDTRGMIVLAIVGIVFNGAAMLRVKKGTSINERVVSLHLLEDVLSWVVVLIGSIVMTIAYLPVLDSVLSLGIAGYILWNVFRTLRKTFTIFLQQKPESVDENEVRGKLMSIPGVTGIHDMHFWTMDGQSHVITLHVVIADNRSAAELEEIKSKVRHALHHLNLAHATIEMEYNNAQCGDRRI